MKNTTKEIIENLKTENFNNAGECTGWRRK
jgi:hypothetical protein